MKKVLFTTIAIIAFAVPAMAEVSFYGSARLGTFWNISDVNGKTTAGFDEHQYLTSWLGLNFNNGPIGGTVEIGSLENGESAPYGQSAWVRLWYGTYKFNSGKITVGQDYNSYFVYSNQVHNDDNSSIGYGATWDWRRPQIKVNLDNGLYFAAIQPTAVPGYYGYTNPGGAVPNSESYANMKLYMPKLNVGYAGKAGSVDYNVGVVGQTYKDDNVGVGKQVTSVLGYVSGKVDFNATSLLLNATFAQNAGSMGFYGREGFALNSKGEYKDALGFEGFLQVTQKVSDAVQVNVGVGYVTDKRDGDNHADDKLNIFVNAPITIAKNFSVTPEFDFYNELKGADGSTQPKSYAVGAKWQISF
jgi:hypothetical protein